MAIEGREYVPELRRELLERALVIYVREYGPERKGVFVTLTNLGNAFGRLSVTQRQGQLLGRSLAIEERGYEKENQYLEDMGLRLRASTVPSPRRGQLRGESGDLETATAEQRSSGQAED